VRFFGVVDDLIALVVFLELLANEVLEGALIELLNAAAYVVKETAQRRYG
jgi:hypothetical protein